MLVFGIMKSTATLFDACSDQVFSDLDYSKIMIQTSVGNQLPQATPATILLIEAKYFYKPFPLYFTGA